MAKSRRTSSRRRKNSRRRQKGGALSFSEYSSGASEGSMGFGHANMMHQGGGDGSCSGAVALSQGGNGHVVPAAVIPATVPSMGGVHAPMKGGRRRRRGGGLLTDIAVPAVLLYASNTLDTKKFNANPFGNPSRQTGSVRRRSSSRKTRRSAR